MKFRSIALIGLVVALVAVGVFAILYLRGEKIQTAQPLSHWGNADAPILSVLTNGSDTTEVLRGWPLIFELRLLHPRTGQTKPRPEALLVASKEGAWTNAIEIQIVNEKRGRQNWPLHLVTSPSERLSLEVDHTAEVAWLLSPEETSKLNPGKYTLTALLDTTASPAAGAWKGKSISMPVDLNIRDAGTITREQESERLQLMAQYHLLRGDSGEAMKQIDQLLAKQPRNVGGLALKGDLLLAERKPEKALQMYNDALDSFYEQYPDEYEPPTLLIEKQHALLKELFVE